MSEEYIYEVHSGKSDGTLERHVKEEEESYDTDCKCSNGDNYRHQDSVSKEEESTD